MAQRHDLGMRLARALGVAFAQDAAIGGHQHAAHRRVGRGQQAGLGGQF
jgi:hypothetical protein